MEAHSEMQIPVFTVWKNNAILKNIFLINSPPVNQNETQQENDEICKINQEFEETLVVGRHPDCDIRVEHPSISRFHLRIHSKPSSKHLSLTDLSSVHGTWISGRRIEPNIRTRMNESDSLRIGGSSRVYKLHWIPVSQAYDVSNPFVPPLDFVELPEDEDEEIIKDESSLGLGNEEVQGVDSVSKGLVFGVLCDDDRLVVEKVAEITEEKCMAVDNECVELENEEVQVFGVLCDDDDRLVVEKVAEKTEEKLTSVDNECVGLESPDMEILRPPFVDENSQVSAQELLDNGNVQSLDSALEGLISPFLDEKSQVFVQGLVDEENVQPLDSALEGLVSQFLDENSQVSVQELVVNENVQLLDSALEGLVPLFLGENWEWVGQKWNYMACPTEEEHPELVKNEDIGSVPVLEALETLFLDENTEQLVLEEEEDEDIIKDESPQEQENEEVQAVDSFSEGLEFGAACDDDVLVKEQVAPKTEEVWNFWCGSPVAPPSPLVTNGILLNTAKLHLDIENQSAENKPEPRMLSERKFPGSVNVNSSLKEHNGGKLWSFWSGNMGVESSVCSSFSDASFLSESENKSSRNGFESPFGSPLMESDQKSASSIWSRRGKLQSAPQISTNISEKKKLRSDQKNVKHEPVSRALFHEVETQEEEEVFTPDKENFTPNTHKSMRKLVMLKEVKNSSSPLLKIIGSPKIYYEDNMMSPSSDKENYSPRTFLEKKTARRGSLNQVKSLRVKEKKGGRMPFQSLLADSPKNSSSETCFPGAAKITSKTNIPEKCSGERTQKWSMLVDTTTLLNKESRKALQLLEGLKGTQLIIPKIVIKDLACLKRQTSFFRRNTEVSSALEWIEDCMVKTQWWIHVQNSTEEVQSVAATPPASPYSSQVSCGTTAGSFPFSALELLSPSTEDHVLDYALSFRRNKNEGQLVLLSDDITLKIKAMAEGIICETAEDFRESLVNPFSERFLWTDSSPRGQTWSYSDDFVLREKFYPSSLKMMMTPKAMENVKGLKLILLHNSQYFERMTAIY
ncbi:FHA domain-containing protein PS1 [Spinacia oleracea]|uniref:FHA domain-containing protein PS1 n=1 Tax=Spinacia oleracea TaxID=3562 RepID=A0A9R0IIT7_SPIOL|nr:FHA domain-containing protein PS1 [Spinacia oleracea]